MKPTPEQHYLSEQNREKNQRKLSERKEFKKEDDLMLTEEVIVIKEDFPDLELTGNLDERLRFGDPENEEEWIQDQHGLSYDAKRKVVKKMPRHRQANPYRAYVLTATETDSDEHKSSPRDGRYVNCWDTEDEDDEAFLDGTRIKETDKKVENEPSDPESVKEEACVDAPSPKEEIDAEAAAIEEFNRICGDYDKPDHHTRFLRSRDTSDDETEDERPKKRAWVSENEDNDDTSENEETSDDDNDEESQGSSDIERIAHVISDAEDDHDGKAEIKKELETLTEVEMKKRTLEITAEIKNVDER